MFTALTAVGQAADHVRPVGHCFVGGRDEGAVAHRAGGEGAGDLVCGRHSCQWQGCCGGRHGQDVADGTGPFGALGVQTRDELPVRAGDGERVDLFGRQRREAAVVVCVGAEPEGVGQFGEGEHRQRRVGTGRVGDG